MILRTGAFALLLLASADGSAPTVDVRPASANVSIGERFRVTLQAHGPNGLRYDFPKTVSNGNIEMIESRTASASSDTAVYEAQLFALGKDAQIPPIEVGYTDADGTPHVVATEPVPLNLVSTLDPNEKNPAPADFAPPVPVLVSRAFWLVNGALGVLLLVGLFLLVRRLRFPKRVSDPAVTPPVSPEEEALDRLGALARDLQRIDARPAYIDLVQILKQYLERRLEAPILEMTSTETLGFVRAHEWTSPQAVGVRDLIATADLVKFGGLSDASQIERHLQFVRDVVSHIDGRRRAHEAEIAREEHARKSA